MTKIADSVPLGYTLYPSQQDVLAELDKEWNRNKVFVLNGPVACHGLGQKILMFDGSLKNVEDILIGDSVMGPDSLPRLVVETHKGTAPMRRVLPERGESWTATDNHLLRVRRFWRSMVEKERTGYFIHEIIEVKDYETSSVDYKRNAWMERAGVEFERKSLPIPPYILGVWLGDGHSRGTALTNMDEVIVAEWLEYANDKELLCRVTNNGSKASTYHLNGKGLISNEFLKLLKDMNLLKNKHIPLNYLTSSREQRLELLAGLIDTDGSTSQSKRSVEITQKSEVLLDNIVYLSRSLGFSASKQVKTVNGVDYYRAHISGKKTEDIPVRLKYKVCPNSNSNQNHYSFTTEDLGLQPFAGISVDGDNLYLLGDFTITHNSGKSLMAVTLAEHLKKQGKSVAIMTPQVVLQDQVAADFPSIPVLKGKTRYSCHDETFPTCEDRFNAYQNLTDEEGIPLRSYCQGCPYITAKKNIEDSQIGFYNLYSYLLGDVGKSDILIVDEAHAIIAQLQELYTLRLYKSEVKYPNNIKTQGDLAVWMEGEVRKMEEIGKEDVEPKAYMKIRGTINKYKMMIDGINRSPGHFFYEKKTSKFKGVDQESIEVRPFTLHHVGDKLWKGHQKILLMSATIIPQDLEYMGLQKLRSHYFEGPSSIPPENRPILVMPIAQMSYANQEAGAEKMSQTILELIEKHQGKGLIHTTYGLAQVFKKHLKHPRLMWHTQDNKSAVYEEFRSTKENRVLVASGMSEGIDLVGTDYEWQVITKIMFPSLGDNLIKRQREMEPVWYDWQAIKMTIQQIGRICRTPTDYGVTYVLDANFNFLYFKNQKLFPQYIKSALQWPKTKKEKK